MRAGRLLALGLAVVLPAAVPAVATVRAEVARTAGVDGISLAGAGVAWASVEEPNTLLVQRAGPGGRARIARLRGYFTWRPSSRGSAGCAPALRHAAVRAGGQLLRGL